MGVKYVGSNVRWAWVAWAGLAIGSGSAGEVGQVAMQMRQVLTVRLQAMALPIVVTDDNG